MPCYNTLLTTKIGAALITSQTKQCGVFFWHWCL